MFCPGLLVSLIMTEGQIYVLPSVVVSDSSDSDSRCKIITWHVIVTASETTRIGPIKLVWELSHHADVDTSTILARYECVSRNEVNDELSSDTSSSPSDSA